MAQRPNRPKNQRPCILACGLVAVLFFIVLVLVAVGAWIYTQRAQAKGQLFASIITPQTGSAFGIQQPVLVEGGAQNTAGVRRIELYADGGLVAVQETTEPTGMNPLVMFSYWTPTTLGRHVLVLRGYDLEGNFIDSTAIFLEITEAISSSNTVNIDAIPRGEDAPLPSINDLATLSGASPDAILSSNPPLAGTDPSAPLPPGTSVTFPPPPSPGAGASPPPPSPPPAPRPGSPTAPTNLAVAADCTTATLTWTDSPDEERYLVYRLDLISGRPVVVATLSANTTTFADPLPGYGDFYYQVASQRGAFQSLGLMSMVTTPGACFPPPPPGTSDLVLVLSTIETDLPYTSIYCYASIDGLPWDHFPPGSFGGLLPTAPRVYSTEGVPGRGIFRLDGHAPGTPLTVRLDCMGRNPPLADVLGEINLSHPPEDWDGTTRSASGTGPGGSFFLTYCIGPSTSPCTTGRGGGAPDPTSIDPYFPPPTNLRMGRTFEICQYQATIAEQITCTIGNMFRGGAHTLMWDWSNPGRIPVESDLIGYRISLWHTETRSGMHIQDGQWTVNTTETGFMPKMFLDHMLSPLCGTRYFYTVYAMTWDRRSPTSTPLFIDTPTCFTPVDVTVRFDSITMDDFIDDQGECCLICPARDSTAELIGNLRVTSGSDRWSVNMSSPHDVDPGGVYSFTTLWGGVYQHTFHLTDPSQTISIEASFYDDDTICSMELRHPGRDCYYSVEIPRQSTELWANFYQQYVGGSGSSQLGCTLSLRVFGQNRRAP